MQCTKCSRDIPDSSAFCKYCGTEQEAKIDSTSDDKPRETKTSATTSTSASSSADNKGFTGEKEGRRYLNGVDITAEDPYWQQEFRKIYTSNGTYKGKFNLAAFLAGAFWPFAKGMPVVGLIWAGAAILASFLAGIGWIIVWIVAGMRANYIRYMYVIEQEQLYF